MAKIAASLEKIKSDFGWLLMGSKKLPVRLYTLQDDNNAAPVSELFYKLHELSPEALAAVEAVVNEHSAHLTPDDCAVSSDTTADEDTSRVGE